MWRMIGVLLCSFIFVLAITPLIFKYAEHVGAIDYPDERKVHKVPKFRLGGLGIYLAFISLSLMFYGYSSQLMAIIVATIPLILIGLADDIKPVPAIIKLIVQIIVSIIAVVYGNLLISNIDIFGINVDFNAFSYPLTVMFLVSCMNIINLIDGLDGLSSGIGAIYFITILIISIIQQRFWTLEIFLSLVMLGGCLGFLKYNFYPSKIFIGDSGSLFLGFIIGIVSILGFKTTLITSIGVPILLLAIPILDTLFAIFRRKLKHQGAFTPDKEHFHHQLMKLKFSQKNTVLLIYLISSIFSASSILLVIKSNSAFSVGIYIILTLGIGYIVFNSDILSCKLNINNRKK